MTDLQERALEALNVFDERRALYDSANKAVKALNPDFPSLVNFIDPAIETSVVKVLDLVLGDEIASYYLNEVSHMKEGGRIEENGKVWLIRTVDDVRAYVAGRAALTEESGASTSGSEG